LSFKITKFKNIIMKEIKFRAWDKTYSLMNYKVQVGNTDYADQNYTCNNIWVDYGDRKSVGWMNADDKCIDLMQFTGMKDKNGKEIYEGDIVKHKFRRIWQTEQHTSQVVWDQGYCCYYLFDGISNHRMRDDIIYEVIGNIYENPELSNTKI